MHVKRITEGSHDETDEIAHQKTHYKFTVGDGDPQMNERLCVWRKAQGLEGEMERER